FGFHVNAKAMALTIEKAKTANVAACTVFRQSHVGRLAAYPLMAMRAGMIGIATADSGRSPKHVAPFGGREARLGTNPISIAVPSDLEAPFYLVMAVFNVAAFRPLKDFEKEVGEFARYLKSTPPSEGSSGVFYPGEIEHIRERQRRRDGIEVEDATWDKLKALATDYKLAAELDLK